MRRRCRMRNSDAGGLPHRRFIHHPPSTVHQQLRLLQRSASLVGDERERRGILHREIREDLAIDFDAGSLHALDEGAVAHPIEARGGVDADDPESAEIALLRLAIPVRVDPTALDGLLRGLPELGTATEGALRRLHDLLLALETRDVRLDAWHGRVSLGLQ